MHRVSVDLDTRSEGIIVKEKLGDFLTFFATRSRIWVASKVNRPGIKINHFEIVGVMVMAAKSGKETGITINIRSNTESDQLLFFS